MFEDMTRPLNGTYASRKNVGVRADDTSQLIIPNRDIRRY